MEHAYDKFRPDSGACAGLYAGLNEGLDEGLDERFNARLYARFYDNFNKLWHRITTRVNHVERFPLRWIIRGRVLFFELYCAGLPRSANDDTYNIKDFLPSVHRLHQRTTITIHLIACHYLIQPWLAGLLSFKRFFGIDDART